MSALLCYLLGVLIYHVLSCSKILFANHRCKLKTIRDREKSFFVGDKVAVKNYRGKRRWATGVVVSCVGNVMYNVKIAPNIIWKRHVDQIMLYNGPIRNEDDDVDFNVLPPVDASSDVDSVAPAPYLDSATLYSDSDQVTNSTCEETSEPRYLVRTRNPSRCYDDYFVYK